MKKTTTITICLAGAGAMFFAGRGCGRNSGGEVGGGSGRVETRVDTVIVRDTLRDTLLVPVDRLVVRFDTVWLPTVSAWVGADGEVAVSAKSDRSESTARTLFNCQSGGMERGASGSPTQPVAVQHSTQKGDSTPRDRGEGKAEPDSVQIAIPVERIVYRTADYRAVVEGFRPSLVELEIYRSTARITRETIRSLPPQRWGIGIQAGWGFTPKGTGPYLGVGVQYRLAAW